MTERKILAMHKHFGTCGVLRCKDCDHLKHDVRYKCELYGISRSEATDWRLSFQACGMYNVPQNMETWTPLLTQINNQYRKFPDPPIEGQIGFEM